ncbi:hypothetical protein OQA88_4762 [Cercophora sp. LCS_1]
MSTFTHPTLAIPITLPPGLTESQVLQFHPFNAWLKTLSNSLTLQRTNPTHPFHADPYVLNSVTIQAYDLFGPTRIGFLKVASSVANSSGEWLPGAVFLRGPSVAMLVMLVPDDVDPDNANDERHVLLTVQPRIAAGSLAFVELPAGMVDEEGNFGGTAAKEIKEELGMEIGVGELVCLSELAASREGEGEDAVETTEGDGPQEREVGDGNLPRGVYPSPGGCDEYIPIYACEKRVKRGTLGEWTGRLTGLRGEGEKITLKLVKMRDVWKVAARDGKTLAALTLWEGLKREGRV